MKETKTNYVVLILVVILVLVSLVQAYQINEIKSDGMSGTFVGKTVASAAGSSNTPTTTTGAAAPEPTNAVPAMVGGC